MRTPDWNVEDGLLGPAGFIFRTPVRAKATRGAPKAAGAGGVGSARALMLERIRRVASRRPEVMVKVSGASKGRKHVREHLAYITRNGELPVERENGEWIHGRNEVRDLAAEWWALRGATRKANARDTINLVLSMPIGTDRSGVEFGATAFAKAEFGGRYDYVIAHHGDTDHPHAHVTVRAVGFDGQVLNPRKADLQRWREHFADMLRAHGVPAEATPRRSRGIVKKGQRQSVRHLDRRQASDVTRAKIAASIQEVQNGTSSAAEGAWIAAVKGRRQRLEKAWTALAESLDAVREGELASEVRRFAASMPPLVSERDEFLQRVRTEIDKARPPHVREAKPQRRR